MSRLRKTNTFQLQDNPEHIENTNCHATTSLYQLVVKQVKTKNRLSTDCLMVHQHSKVNFCLLLGRKTGSGCRHIIRSTQSLDWSSGVQRHVSTAAVATTVSLPDCQCSVLQSRNKSNVMTSTCLFLYSPTEALKHGPCFTGLHELPPNHTFYKQGQSHTW